MFITRWIVRISDPGAPGSDLIVSLPTVLDALTYIASRSAMPEFIGHRFHLTRERSAL